MTHDQALAHVLPTKTDGNVFDYFNAKMGRKPDDATLLDLPVDSGCGVDCKSAIDSASAFLHCTEMADSRMNEQVIALCEQTVSIFWRG